MSNFLSSSRLGTDYTTWWTFAGSSFFGLPFLVDFIFSAGLGFDTGPLVTDHGLRRKTARGLLFHQEISKNPGRTTPKQSSIINQNILYIYIYNFRISHDTSQAYTNTCACQKIRSIFPKSNGSFFHSKACFPSKIAIEITIGFDTNIFMAILC